MAVFTFFAISGFLVAGSYDRSHTIAAWVLARAVRIFPGLAVVLLLTAFVLGPLVTTLPLSAYFTHPLTLSYVPNTLSLVLRQTELPGVFQTGPHTEDVNGSLWTLPYEVMCYVAVLGVGLAGAFRSRRALAAVTGVYLVVIAATVVLPSVPVPLWRLVRELGPPFACGVAIYFARSWLLLSPWVLLGLALGTYSLSGTLLYDWSFVLTLSYGTFVLAYLPGGWIRRYNSVGDYSYGVYIYAFPIQLAMTQAFGPIGPLQNILISTPIVLVLACLSWHFVENPALTWMRRRQQRKQAVVLAGHGHESSR
jgi:peptidoglycan/LPS O-acetylase OafA/YrhL